MKRVKRLLVLSVVPALLKRLAVVLVFTSVSVLAAPPAQAASATATDASTPSTTDSASTTPATTPATGDNSGKIRQIPGLGQNVEEQLDNDGPFTPWKQDDSAFSQQKKRLEVQQVTKKHITTKKLTDLVPPIRFASGKAQIPEEYITKLREILNQMRDRVNVRLHFVGHSDNVKLKGEAKRIYGDNLGLSKERAGTAAEYFKQALDLPPEAISYEGLGDSRPIASNDSEAGRAKNRRVEIEVWYDEVSEQTEDRQVLVNEQSKRIKVCRVETLCLLHYKEGHSRRAVLKNLVPPLHYNDETLAQIPPAYLQQLTQAMDNLKGKEHVQLRFIGYTDNAALSGRDARIYGDHVGLSKANARRVALAVQDALHLPAQAVASSGKGANYPLASNNSEKGRALNRRIEVEFWHDDPLEDLPDTPQICPEAAAAETVERIYNPPDGDIKALYFNNGQPVIPEGYTDRLKRAMADIADKGNVRLRFIGYTSNRRLDRRTAMVYGDDIGLSTSRARRAMEKVKQLMGLADKQAEYEGRGYVQSNDVVNAGFVEAERSKVQVQVVYDELALLDDNEGVQINRVTRDVRTQNPYALNLMRISVDGQPLNDPGKSIPDVQRCTDVALDKAKVQFKFDDLKLKPRLNITAWPNVIAVRDNPLTAFVENRAHFKLYSNYPAYIQRAEVRIFGPQQSTRDTPLWVIPLDQDGTATWPFAQNGQQRHFTAPRTAFKYVVRVYGKSEGKAKAKRDGGSNSNSDSESDSKSEDKDGAAVDDFDSYSESDSDSADSDLGTDSGENQTDANQGDSDNNSKSDTKGEDTNDNAPFDETSEQTLWVVDQLDSDLSGREASKEVLVGYGENRLAVNNIPMARNSGTVSVSGQDVPPGYQVWFGGYAVPVNDQGAFGAELILPAGLHTVEVALTDAEGNGNVYLRELQLKPKDWFYVGIADLTLAQDSTNGPAALVTGDTTHYDNDLSLDGRLAFYTKGQFKNEWQLTASADTREGPLKDVFSNFVNKAPDAVFRRMDSKEYYPTYGDDGTVEEDAPTSGKFYLKLEKERSFGLWGNFKVDYTDTQLTHVDRALYGANVNWEGEGTTGFGERRFRLNAFAAEPGTLAARDELRGTSGSLYYLRHQDILSGSERVRVEVRDAVTGLVVGVKNLLQGLDYDVDYIQGRLLLREPLSAFARSTAVVNGGDLSAYQAYLVARYEYTPGFDDVNEVARGGRAHYWLGDHLKLGLTHESQSAQADQARLNGVDLTLRKSAHTWLRLERSQSQGLVSSSLLSSDGGFSFQSAATAADMNLKANAQRLDASVRLDDISDLANGQFTFYHQRLDRGYSAPGLIAPTDTSVTGARLLIQAEEASSISFEASNKTQRDALHVSAVEVDVQTQVGEHWRLQSGLRRDNRDDHSPVVPLTQRQGYRDDLALKLGYDSRQRWSSYGFAQQTLQVSGNREHNNRLGLGGAYRTSERFKLNAEASAGDTGPAIALGSDYKLSDNTNLYNVYTLENQRSDNGVRARKGNLALGFKSRYSDSASVYMEERYTHGDVPTGLTHALGFDLAATERLNFGANLDLGTLRDQNTAAKIKRSAAGLRMGYHFDALTFASALEYRVDDTEQPDTTSSKRTTWLTKNSFKYLLNPDWRLLGKFNHSTSHSSLGEFYNGNFTEAVLGYAYRPVDFNGFNTLAKYTYFYNLPASDQITLSNSAAAFIQKSHILSLDVMTDLTRRLSLGGKLAYRQGQLAQDRVNPQFFTSNASLYILRADWHVVRRWDALVEARRLQLHQAGDIRSGFLLGLYRQAGDHIKAGVGYNFTDFSDDLTDLSFDSQGFFVNVIGKF